MATPLEKYPHWINPIFAIEVEMAIESAVAEYMSNGNHEFTYAQYEHVVSQIMPSVYRTVESHVEMEINKVAYGNQ